MLEKKLQSILLNILSNYGLMARAVEYRGRNDCPDIVIIGQPTLWLELKTPTGKVRAGQRREHNKMRDHGAHVYVIRTEEELHALIKTSYPDAVYRVAVGHIRQRLRAS